VVSPRVRGESVHPRLKSGAFGRPLNFTVRGRYVAHCLPRRCAIPCAPRIVGLCHRGVPCDSRKNTSTPSAFEVTSKRRKGFPSETRVKRGTRVVGGFKELSEKLGRNDPCPCLSGRRFQELLHAQWTVRRVRSASLLSESEAIAGVL